MLKKIRHVGILVDDLDRVVKKLERFCTQIADICTDFSLGAPEESRDIVGGRV